MPGESTDDGVKLGGFGDTSGVGQSAQLPSGIVSVTRVDSGDDVAEVVDDASVVATVDDASRAAVVGDVDGAGVVVEVDAVLDVVASVVVVVQIVGNRTSSSGPVQAAAYNGANTHAVTAMMNPAATRRNR